MGGIFELFTEHPMGVIELLVMYYVFNAIVSGMPDPRPDSFYYKWLFASLHTLSGNLNKNAAVQSLIRKGDDLTKTAMNKTGFFRSPK